MIIEEIIECARKSRASDIHLIGGEPPSMRVDGDIVTFPEEFHKGVTDEVVESMLDDKQLLHFKDGGDVDFAYVDKNYQRYRVNVYHQMGKAGAVIRLFPTGIPSLEQLKMPEVLKKLAMLPRGLVLVTGPTGSGKSTTLAAMMDYANAHRRSHIITIEDPVEYVHRSKECIVSQREVGVDVTSFQSALRSAMREDPDIILVGEMRDFETISAAVTAAETGHLVFSTLHTTGAAKTIDRIIDVFPPHQQQQIRAQLASVLKAVVTQQLVKKQKGGRMAALEVLLANDAISNMIREGKIHQIDSAIQTGAKDGMILLDKHLADLVNQGDIEVEEALAKCGKEAELKRFLHSR